MVYHIPVLLRESLEQISVKPSGTYVDLTLGGGGHTAALLAELGPEGRLFCFDRDGEALGNAPEDSRVQVVQANYRDMWRWLDFYGVEAVDGILADLGVSSRHFDMAGRGFSYMQDGPLDMRMGRTSGKTAADVVNGYSESALAEVLFSYGELRSARRIAKRIIGARLERPIETTFQLRDVFGPAPSRSEEYYRTLSCVFQALRIEVNGELDALEAMLLSTPNVVKPGGRVVIISYHSLEDKLVKNFLREGRFRGSANVDLYGQSDAPFRLLTRGTTTPTEEEVVSNSRARSARMRVGVRL